MLALIAGRGDLPPAIVAALRGAGEPVPLICEMRGFVADLPADLPRRPFRLEHLGSFLADLRALGVTEVCLAGAVTRPDIDPHEIDAATAPLVPRLQAAITKGDDGALREIIAILEGAGLTLRGAHDIAPDLLPPAGVLTRAAPAARHKSDAVAGDAGIVEMGRADVGQACVVSGGAVIATEGQDGTDAMLGRIDRARARRGLLYKAPKPQQDRRADLPVIGPKTARMAAEAGLDGIVIEAGGVMVLDLPQVLGLLDSHGMFLWVRPKGDT